MDKNAKKKSAKGVKGDSEVYRKNGEKAKQAKASKKEPKKTVQEPPRHRQSAYEEYKNRYEAKPDTTVSSQTSLGLSCTVLKFPVCRRNHNKILKSQSVGTAPFVLL